MMYDNDRGGGLKGMNIMAKSKQKTHKKGEVFAWKYNNSTIILVFQIILFVTADNSVRRNYL